MPQMNVTVLSVAKLGPFALGIESSLLLGAGGERYRKHAKYVFLKICIDCKE